MDKGLRAQGSGVLTTTKLIPALAVEFEGGDDELGGLVTAALADYLPTAIHELGPDERPAWRVFFSNAAARAEAARTLAEGFTARGVTVAPIDVADEEWAARSQADLRAVRVGRLVVAPPWAAGEFDDPDLIRIIVQPSTGFGTGHHATTRMCLDLVQAVACEGTAVVDVGTGSGVLAMAAACLGARAVTAIDDDPDALANARDNAGRNPRARDIAFIEGDLATSPLPVADVLLANLTGATLARHAERLSRSVAPGGALVLGGILLSEERQVTAAFAPFAVVTDVRRDREWVGLLLSKRQSD